VFLLVGDENGVKFILLIQYLDGDVFSQDWFEICWNEGRNLLYDALAPPDYHILNITWDP